MAGLGCELPSGSGGSCQVVLKVVRLLKNRSILVDFGKEVDCQE